MATLEDRISRWIRVGKRKGSTIKEGTPVNPAWNWSEKELVRQKRIEWIQLCFLRFSEPRLRLQTEGVGFGLWLRRLFDFSMYLEVTPGGGSCPTKKTETEETQFLSIYISVAISFIYSRAHVLPFFVTKLPFRDSKFPFQPRSCSFWKFALSNSGLNARWPRLISTIMISGKSANKKLRTPTPGSTVPA